MPLILCFTVIASVSLGILAAYIAVFGILSTFRHPAQPESAPAADPDPAPRQRRLKRSAGFLAGCREGVSPSHSLLGPNRCPRTSVPASEHFQSPCSIRVQ